MKCQGEIYDDDEAHTLRGGAYFVAGSCASVLDIPSQMLQPRDLEIVRRMTDHQVVGLTFAYTACKFGHAVADTKHSLLDKTGCTLEAGEMMAKSRRFDGPPSQSQFPVLCFRVL